MQYSLFIDLLMQELMSAVRRQTLWGEFHTAGPLSCILALFSMSLFNTNVWLWLKKLWAFSQNITSLSAPIIFPPMALTDCPSFLSSFYRIAILEHSGFVQSQQLEHIKFFFFDHMPHWTSVQTAGCICSV